MPLFSRPRRPAGGGHRPRSAARLAMALSGVMIAGLALVPAASAATTLKAHPTSSGAIRQAGVVPDAGDCYTFGDGETYAEGYCSMPPGTFFVWVRCQELADASRFITRDGPVRNAGAGTTSYARCPDNWIVANSGTVPQG
jgi:hypothetical protein